MLLRFTSRARLAAMRGPTWIRSWALWMILGLLALLLALASLQYRWLKQLSEDERERLHVSIDVSATRLCEDFDRELSRAFIYFQPHRVQIVEDPLIFLTSQFKSWTADAPYPSFIRSVYLITPLENGAIEIGKIDAEQGHAEACEWPAGIESYHEPMRMGNPVPPLSGSLPGLVLPIGPVHFLSPPGESRPTTRPYSVIELNIDFITKNFLPQLVNRYFIQGKGLELDVTVFRGDDPEKIIYTSGQAARRGNFPPEVTEQSLFSLRLFPELMGFHERPHFGQPPREEDRPPPDAPMPSASFPPVNPRAFSPFHGQWRLVVTHPYGSLEEAVRRMHFRHMAIGMSILVLLGVSGSLVIISSHRAQRLARQQMEFVAGISHELCTPLTAIRSAGQNLADGVVSNQDQVMSYGALVEREGRRLSEMLNGVMAFAGIVSGQKSYVRRPICVATIIDEVVSDYGRVLHEKGFVIEKKIAPEVPTIEADASALRRALQNLLDNAIKYAKNERWIGIHVRLVSRAKGEEIEMTVSDRGLGIPEADLPHIFDPFYRSEEVVAGGITGSGLGLSIVKHIVEGHGGRIEARSTIGQGTSFCIHLPVPPDSSDPEGDHR